MKAIFEVEFDKDMMIDQKTLDDIYNGSWFELIKELYAMEGMGIFENELKLVAIEDGKV
jgi:hypothetical protein